MDYKFDYFSNTKPNIINQNIENNFENLLKNTSNKSYDTVDYLSVFYEDFIKPNLFMLIMLLLIALFLLYKYLEKKEKKENFEENKKEDPVEEIKRSVKESTEMPSNILIPQLYKQDDYKSFRPTFNPSLPIDRQQSFTNYLPDNIPVKLNNEFINHNQINSPKVVRKEYIPFLHNPENRDSLIGVNNSYLNSQDSTIINSLGYPMNYNKTTSDAIEYATQLNRNNIDEMSNYNNYVNSNLVNSDPIQGYQIDKPYL